MKTKAKLTTILPPLPAVGKRRLRKLIAFLRALPRAKWDFNSVVKKWKENGHACGTVCCAIGWVPKIFPKLARWAIDKTYGSPTVWVEPTDESKRSWLYEFRGTHVAVFRIPEDHSDLFIPGRQRLVHSTLPHCGMRATAKQVAKMLEHYITLTETPAPTP